MSEDQKDAKQHRIESFYGTFSRCFSLPTDADESKITAKSDNGVLKVYVPKTAISEPKPIKVSVD